MAEARQTPTSEPSSAAAPRSLPPTLFLPRPSNGIRAARGGSAAGTGHRHDGLLEAVRLVGRDVDPGVAGADILELAMAKGPMFSWLSYWPEEGYPKEDQPY